MLLVLNMIAGHCLLFWARLQLSGLIDVQPFFFVVESLKDFCGWNVIYFADVDVSKEFGHHVVSSEISSLRATLYVVIIVS